MYFILIDKRKFRAFDNYFQTTWKELPQNWRDMSRSYSEYLLMACDYNCYVEGKKTSYRIYICPWGILIRDFYGMRSVGDNSFVSNFEIYHWALSYSSGRKPRDWMLYWSYSYEICQASRQQSRRDCLSNFRAIGKVSTRIPRLRDFTRSSGKTSAR